TQSWATNAGTVGTPAIAGGIPLTYGSNFTDGATGRGSVTLSGSGQTFEGDTNVANVNYRFDDGRWKITSDANLSTSTRSRPNPGFFSGLTSVLINPVRVSFSNINPDYPGKIQVFDNNNQPVDIYDIRNYRLNTASTGPYDTASNLKSA